MQICPQPPGFSFVLSGPAFLMFVDEGRAVDIDITLTQSVAVGDLLRIGYAIHSIDGEPLNIYHGGTLVGTQEGPGLAEFDHIADNTSTLLRFRSGSNGGGQVNILLGGISIDLNP